MGKGGGDGGLKGGKWKAGVEDTQACVAPPWPVKLNFLDKLFIFLVHFFL